MKNIYILIGLTLTFNYAFAYQKPKIPSSLEEMITTSDLVVIGNIGNVISIEKFYGYQKNAKQLAELDKLSNIPIGLMAVDYEIVIENIIYNKNKVKNIENGISFRSFQSPFLKNRQVKDQEKSIFFLSKTPAKGNNYGVKSSFYRLQMNGNKPVSYFFEGRQITVKRADNKENLSSYDFLDKVVELSEKLNRKNMNIK